MVTMTHWAILATAAAVGAGTHAEAQTIQGGFELRVSNVVSPSQPTATVEVWAWFDNVPGVSEVFGGANFDLVAGEGLWSNVAYWLNAPDPPSHLIVGSRINNVIAGQLHLPPINIFGDPSNPIKLFAARWSTADFTLRNVSLDTKNTNNFFVTDAQTGAAFQVWPNVTHGSGSITVVPSPAPLAVAGMVLATGCLMRRR
jgi:hypothetical protein